MPQDKLTELQRDQIDAILAEAEAAERYNAWEATSGRPSLMAGPVERPDCWYISRYIGGSLITMGGPYSTRQDAMREMPDVGVWVELLPTEYRSDDGRTLIRCPK